MKQIQMFLEIEINHMVHFFFFQRRYSIYHNQVI